jgi:hypothetical protein
VIYYLNFDSVDSTIRYKKVLHLVAAKLSKERKKKMKWILKGIENLIELGV